MCPPSGNLVDSLPLDAHTDARWYWFVLGSAFFYGWACKNVVADKQCCSEHWNLYRSEVSSICMNELCVNINHRAFQNLSSQCRSLFKISVKKWFFENFTLSNRKKSKNILRGLQLCVSLERKSGWRFTARFTYGCKRILIRIGPALLNSFSCPVTLLGR